MIIYILLDSSWIGDFFNTIIGSAIGGIIAILLFYKTIQNDKKKEAEKKEILQKEKLRYFQSLIVDICEDIEDQLKFYKEFYLSLKKRPSQIPYVNKKTHTELDRVIHKLPQEEYFQAYINQFGNSKEIINEFRQLYSGLDYFDANFKTLISYEKNALEAEYQKKIEFRDNIEELMDKVSSLILRKNTSNPHLANFINRVIVDFHTNKPPELKLDYYYENFIEKIRKEFINYSLIDTEVRDFLPEIKRLTILYHTIDAEKETVATDFERFHQAFEKEYSNLKEASKRILNY